MAFNLKYHPVVKSADLPRINAKMRERIRRAIESRLVTAPQEYGLPLRKSLKGYWKLRVGDYHVVFKVVGEMVSILGMRHAHPFQRNRDHIFSSLMDGRPKNG